MYIYSVRRYMVLGTLSIIYTCMVVGGNIMWMTIECTFVKLMKLEVKEINFSCAQMVQFPALGHHYIRTCSCN